ncbi:MAG: 2-amino-4-hydroxy-6-hydroxymethyldihydropteridine diphosphokinase [Pseudomonadota bacterium]
MVHIAVAIGSNINREQNIERALDALSDAFGELAISCIYQSAARNADENNGPLTDYYNLVVCFESASSIAALKYQLKAIEQAAYRQRNVPEVSLDLDLLLYDNYIGQTAEVTLPHPDIEHCDYVLKPLSELMPESEHPQLKQSYRHLWMHYSGETDLRPVDFIWRNQLISTAVSAPMV